MRLPNGFGSVHKIAGNRRKPYRVRITVGWEITKEKNKKQKYKIVGYYATKEEGLIALADYNNNPYILENKNITFKDVYDKWSKEHFSKIVPSSKRIWIAAYKHSEILHNKNFRSIKVLDLENTINTAIVGGATKIRMKSLYNMMYKYAIKHEITDKNYSVFCEIPNYDKKITRTPFSDEEIELLWKNVHIPFVDMILVNIYSGLRPSELLNLENKNIDINNKIMVGGLKTKAGIDRKIPISNIIFDLIRLKYNISNNKLFNKEDGTEMTYSEYRNRFKKIMNKLNMNHKPHDTRHTFITKAKQCKVDEYVLKLIVGHKIEDITENIYTHRTNEELLIEINKIK